MAEVPSSPAHHHRATAPTRLRAAVLTVSDSRSRETDHSGRLMVSALEEAGHQLQQRHLLPDDPEQVAAWLQEMAAREDVDLVLINGGTGVTRRDRTYEAVSRLLEKTLPGFGELFRMLSYRAIGAAAMASRATAGTLNGKLVFCTPGSPAAVQLAMETLILPEAGHLVGELRRQG